MAGLVDHAVGIAYALRIVGRIQLHMPRCTVGRLHENYLRLGSVDGVENGEVLAPSRDVGDFKTKGFHGIY